VPHVAQAAVGVPSSMFTPTAPAAASSAVNAATSAGSSPNPPSMSTVSRHSPLTRAASARVSSRASPDASGLPDAAATPRLVVPTAANPAAASAAADV
jgi:hypothetical protein